MACAARRKRGCFYSSGCRGKSAQLRSCSKGKGRTIVPTVTEDERTPPRSLTTRSRQIPIILHNHLGDEHKPDARHRPNPTTLGILYPHILKKKQTKHPNPGVRSSSLCHVVHTPPLLITLSGFRLQTGRMETRILRLGVWSMGLRSGFSGRGLERSEGPISLATIPRHGTLCALLDGQSF